MKNFNFRFGHEKSALPIAALAFFLASLFSYQFFPGLISYDSMLQFQQTLGLSELHDAHPVLMVYLWRILLHAYDHIGVMLVFHQLVYWSSIGLFACLVSRRMLVRLLILLLIGLCPPLAILSLHLWKDVGMVIALALAVVLLLGYVRRPHWGWLVGAALALFFAVAVRINGFIPAMPLLMLLCYFAARRLARSRLQVFGLTFAGMLVLVMAHQMAMGWINAKAQRTYGMGTLVVWDMVSISLAEKKDLLPVYLERKIPGDTLALLEQHNSREGNNGSFEVVSPMPPKEFQKQLVRDWLALIVEHPQAYLHHRAHVLAVLLGVLDREIYYPYHRGIENNDLNIRFTYLSPEKQEKYFHMFDRLADTIFYRPWVYCVLLLIAAAAAGLLLIRRKGNPQLNLLVLATAMSGLLSTLSLLIIATAADHRYISWSIFSGLMASCMACAALVPLLAARPPAPAVAPAR